MARQPDQADTVKVRKLRISANLGDEAAAAIRQALFPDVSGISVISTGAITVEVNVPVEGPLDLATRAASAERLIAAVVGGLRTVSATQTRATTDKLFTEGMNE